MSEHSHGTPEGTADELRSGEPSEPRVAGRPRTIWSGEAIAVIGTGVALLVAMISGFLSLSSRLDELTRHRENRLASVQTHIEDRVEAFRQTVDGTLSGQNARMTAFEVRLAELEVRLQSQDGL
ncbi:MAG: hypothetical protein OXJ90_13960 [Spirochaetaceae bacterium]|nr:hypothetical protein [Spirochaetaceae bacterium]